MYSIFTKIISRELPAYIVAEDESHLAFLDINPLNIGHVLVIPKKEINYIFDMDLQEYSILWQFTRKVSKAMEKVLKCKRIGVAVIGLDVPHVHIQLIPLNSAEDINFSKPKLRLSDEEFTETMNIIISAI